MDTKLTLKLDDLIIEKAKVYAKKQHTSLSKMIENYLSSVTENVTDNEEVTPLVKSLTGIVQVPQDYNPKKAYSNYLSEKYK